MSPAAEPGRARRSVATWLTGVLSAAVVAFVGFLATPLLVRWLGDSAWGAWAVVAEWLGYLGLSQLAMGPGALTIFLLRAHTAPDAAHPSLTAVARRGLRLYLLAALALAPAALLLAWWAPRGLHAPQLMAQLRAAVAIAAFGSLALTPPLLFRGVLETVQRGYLVRAAVLAQSLCITGLSLWWVWMRWGLVGMAAANVAGMALGAALWWRWARRWLPAWRATPPAPLPWKKIWSANWPLALALLGNQINLLTDNTVVGFSLGAGAVAGFALTQSLPLLAGAQLTDIGAVSWAGLGEMRARGDAAFAHRVIELASTVLGVGLALMALVAAFNPPFVALWVGPAHYDGALLTWATAAGMAVFSFLCFFSWLLDTQGDTRRRLAISSLGSVLNLALSLLLVRRWGVAGVALGTLLAYLATDAWNLPRLAVRLYGVPAAALARALLSALLRGGVWAALLALVAFRLAPASSWPIWILEASLAGLATLAWCWAVVLRPADRAAWRARWLALRASRAASTAA